MIEILSSEEVIAIVELVMSSPKTVYGDLCDDLIATMAPRWRISYMTLA